MIAKYSGYCKETNQKIIAGETEIVKINGVWQCAKKDNRTRSQRVQDAVFASEMAAPDWDERYAEMQAEDAAYEEDLAAAAQRLHQQFSDTPVSVWLKAINATIGMSFFAPPVKFTSAEKENAFNKEISNL